MAVVVVGEAFLSAFIEVVLDRLASPEVVDLIHGKKINVNLVQRLKNTLYAVEAVLNDAEQKQIHDSCVNNWLDDLKDALYVADDILDHISTKGALSNKNKQVTTVNYFSRLFNFEERDMVRKLEDIVATLECILKLKDIIGLQHIATHHSSWRTPSTSLQDRSIILKRFLIILDDVWTEDCDSWNSLLKPLQYGTMGSKILVTTRSEKVASMVQTLQPYSLQQLCEEDCWSVFANNACLSPDEKNVTSGIGIAY